MSAEVSDKIIDEQQLQVEYWPIGRAQPYARNARTHSPKQIAQIATSIETCGFANPILVGDDNVVIAGHGRLEAARSLGMTKVPVIVLSGLTDLQRRQLILADNRIALNAGWDADLLRLELNDLRELGGNLKMIGFTAAELSLAFSGQTKGLTDEDEIRRRRQS